MDFAAIAPSVVTAVGGLFGNSSSNKSAAKAAAAANAFTERQMKNRHQWETDDLEKAGLNRILSATNGAPSMGSSAKAEVFNQTDDVTKSAKSGLEAALAKATINKTNADAALSQEAISTQKTQQSLNMSAAQKAAAEAAGAQQFNSIKKPLGDLAKGAGDITGSALGLFRRFQADPAHTKFPNPLEIFNKLRGKN